MPQIAAKATIATVKVGTLEFEGLLHPEHGFGIAIVQVARLFQFPIKHACRDVNAILGNGSQFPIKWKTTLNPKAVNVLPLKDFERLILELTVRQNPTAIAISRALVGLGLVQLYSDAFDIHLTKEERQAELIARTQGIDTRKTLTDAIQAWLKANHIDDIALYPLVTDTVYLRIFGRKASQLKTDWKCKNPRDHMTERELKLVDRFEDLIAELIEYDNLHPLLAAKQVCEQSRVPVITR